MALSDDDTGRMFGRLKCASLGLSRWSKDDSGMEFEMFISRREAGDYSDAIDWAVRRLDRGRAEAHGVKLVAISLAAIASILALALALSGSPAAERDHASDSGELVERRAFCPTCGAETWAMNREVVCRNEGCAMYGVAVEVPLAEASGSNGR